MIYSGVDDNWMRIELLHSIANDFYQKTKDSKHRQHRFNPSLGLYMDIDHARLMDQESCAVGMIMVWSVITIESLINHAIAEISESESDAISKIESPQKHVKSKIARSSLAKKLLILGGSNVIDVNVLKCADFLADTRNVIVHDKPFELFQDPDGDVEIKYFRERGDQEGRQRFFEELDEFYQQAQILVRFIEKYFFYFSAFGGCVCFDRLRQG